MKAPLRNRFCGFLVTLALTFAMTATAFAHRAPSADDEALKAFFLSGGSLGDLCGDMAMGPDGDDCPLCRLEKEAALPPDLAGGGRDAGLLIADQVLPGAAPLPGMHLAGPALGARAPPFF